MNALLNRRKATRATATATAIVLAALVMTGCGAPAAPVSAQDAAPTYDAGHGVPDGDKPLLPMSSMFSVLQAPLMDGDATFTGETASIANPDYDFVEIFDKPAGRSLGALSPEQVVPVVGRAVAKAPGIQAPDGEWLRVMLPSRVALPSAADDQLRPRINQGTAWVWGKDVKVTGSRTHIFIDKTNGSVTVGPLGGAPGATFPAEIGADVPTGPTFVAQSFATSWDCSGGAFLPLSAQGTNADGLEGQSVNPIAIAGPGDDCFTGVGEDLTRVLPNMVRLSPADSVELAKHAVPGTPIDVIAGGQAG